MTAINPYLNFNGNTEEAFNFYKSVFGREFLALMRFKDNPGCGQMADSDKERIMHVALPIGNGTVLMATDALESMGQKLTVGNNFYIAISPESKEEAERLFNGLCAGGKIEMPLQDMFWGAYYGSFTDKFGVQWMVNYDKNRQNEHQLMAQ
jgi:PhnB protein